MKKTIYLFLILIIIISLILCLQSCGNSEKGREVFSPESGAYEIMLDPDDWSELTLSFEQPSNQLGLFSSSAEFILIIDCYAKTSLSDVGISAIDSFIEFYKTLENGKILYESSESENIRKTPDDFTEVDKKHMKKSDVSAGKRHTIHLRSGDSDEILNEIIYLETESYLFAMSYGAYPEKFDGCQKAVNDVIAHIKTEK
ncbi:MAG: hypothetical protein FWF92_02315 [Oscillospiraceae bacterium]|nr:hypothetical protein [Oscillospiraceae bacterium]